MSHSNSYAHFFSGTHSDSVTQARKAVAMSPHDVIETLAAVAVSQYFQTPIRNTVDVNALNAAMAPYKKTGSLMSKLIEFDLGMKASQGFFKQATHAQQRVSAAQVEHTPRMSL